MPHRPYLKHIVTAANRGWHHRLTPAELTTETTKGKKPRLDAANFAGGRYIPDLFHVSLLCVAAPSLEVNIANRQNNCVGVFEKNVVSGNFDCCTSNGGRRVLNGNLGDFFRIQTQLLKC